MDGRRRGTRIRRRAAETAHHFVVDEVVDDVESAVVSVVSGRATVKEGFVQEAPLSGRHRDAKASARSSKRSVAAGGRRTRFGSCGDGQRPKTPFLRSTTIGWADDEDDDDDDDDDEATRRPVPVASAPGLRPSAPRLKSHRSLLPRRLAAAAAADQYSAPDGRRSCALVSAFHAARDTLMPPPRPAATVTQRQELPITNNSVESSACR